MPSIVSNSDVSTGIRSPIDEPTRTVILQEFLRLGHSSGVILDLGAGLLGISEDLEAGGISYVATSPESTEVALYAARGHRIHEFVPGRHGLDRLEEIVAGLTVRAVFIPEALLASVARSTMEAVVALVEAHRAVAVLTATNLGFSRISYPLALTPEASTSHGPIGLLSGVSGERGFREMLRLRGLAPIDVARVTTDWMPDEHDHIALQRGASLNALLEEVSGVSGRDVTAFVSTCLPSEFRSAAVVAATYPAPFLSIVMRTQFRRMAGIREGLTSLAGQTCRDFEVLILPHHVAPIDRQALEQVVAAQVSWLRERIRIIPVNVGGRVAPLNVGFREARGAYTTILDDDDMPMAHWVEEFQQLASSSPGRVLRTVAVRQNISECKTGGRVGFRSDGPMERLYDKEFSHISHLIGNESPPIILAFPTGAFRDLGIVFDSSLNTTEDWDYLLRCASVLGVASSGRVTGIYHWWMTGESSRSVHSPGEWQRNYHEIQRKLRQRSMILDGSEVGRLIELQGELGAVRDVAFQAQRGADEARALLRSEEAHRGCATAVDLRELHVRALLSEQEHGRLALLARVGDILESRSWKIAAPLRFGRRLFGGSRAPRLLEHLASSAPELSELIGTLEGSRSWRSTAWLRRS